jgi:hypothetical protein
VTDFGLARLRESNLSVTGEALGTPSYMPPEQARGDVRATGAAADVYSLGAVLYCLLTGRPPFQAADPVQTMRQVCDAEPVPPRSLNAAVPLDLETICLKCLQKEPAKRYASAAELAEDVRRFQDGEPIRARRVGAGERAARWSRKNPVMAGLMGAVATLLVVGSLLAWGLAAWALGEKGRADRQTDIATAKAAEAKNKAREADEKAQEAKENEKQAKFEARSAKHARHHMQLDLALRARERSDWDMMQTMLNQTEPEHLDTWETRHVRNLWLRSLPLRAYCGHTASVRSACFSPDGKRVLTGSLDKTARLWDGQPAP